ncbi:beta-phosphoglucomutase [Enterococcus sp. CWB-B31]|uniref:beta-phosphoglucomutase n=1 Tax=Enterococcus sp. CWB-B31 TaxID=2885159 RepID=UPI001E344BF3|nr:beta-phosphoglucomutase [Enterococcus sp. CWB-B31]MCB5954902.1 beta-phosphoglucomutase [Enterococcus sp. CWB-B31]
MRRGFIFDLDGVITDTAKYHYIAWKDLGATLGITIDPVFNEQLKGISRMDSLDRILAYGGKETVYSKEEKEQLAEKKNDHYVELLQTLSPADLLPGVKEFISQAKERKIPCAIASASKNAPVILEKLGVTGYFSYIVDPDTLNRGKPDPEIFLKAAEALAVQPQEAVGFEDAQAGIDGINAAGMYAVGIVENEKLLGADQLVYRLDELAIDELLKK